MRLLVVGTAHQTCELSEEQNKYAAFNGRHSQTENTTNLYIWFT